MHHELRFVFLIFPQISINAEEIKLAAKGTRLDGESEGQGGGEGDSHDASARLRDPAPEPHLIRNRFIRDGNNNICCQCVSVCRRGAGGCTPQQPISSSWPSTLLKE